MANAISKEYNFKSLIKYSSPTIAMFVFMSLYTIIDAFFIANYVGKSGVASINIVFPLYQVFAAIGLMFGSGGSAYLAKKIGEGKQNEVHGDFSFIICVGIAASIVLGIIGIIFLNEIVLFLGTTRALYNQVYIYALLTFLFAPFIIFKCLCNELLMSAGQPKLGLHSAIVGGISNVGLDFLFIVVFKMGMMGAALGTYLAMFLSSLIGLFYFKNSSSNIHFATPRASLKVVTKVMTNGSSEMVSEASMGITTLLFNFILLDIAGEDGVTAISIILYVQFIMLAIFLGYSIGIGPIFSYNLGAQNHERLHRFIKYALLFIGIVSILVIVIALITCDYFVAFFVGRNSHVFEITKHGLYLFSLSYIFNGFNIFTSAFFTSLNNGKVSAFLSFFKNLCMQVICLLVLPKLLGIDGVWLAIPVSEAIAFVLSISLLLKYRKVYHY